MIVMIAFLVDYLSIVTRLGLNQFSNLWLLKGCPCSFVLPCLVSPAFQSWPQF